MAKLRAVLIGATGLAASPRSAGKTYADALRASNGMLAWFVPEPLPEAIARMTVLSGDAVQAKDYDIAFSAVEADVARELEPRLARDIPVFSAASAFRYDADVPLLIPPVNAAHSPLIHEQRRQRGWKGFIVPIPNCTTTGLAVTLAPLAERFGVKAVLMTSLQAMSGAGRSPGVIGRPRGAHPQGGQPRGRGAHPPRRARLLHLHPRRRAGGPHRVRLRVAREEGHRRGGRPGDARVAGRPLAKDLPSSPPRWIEVLDDPFRPQPRMDRDTHGGMATSVGRIREDGVLENGFKYVLVSHNTKMGAARGAILVAELLRAQGLLG